MTAVSATAARSDLYRLIDTVNEDSTPITITGRRGNAVLIGEADWSAIQETLYLQGIPSRQALTKIGIKFTSSSVGTKKSPYLAGNVCDFRFRIFL